MPVFPTPCSRSYYVPDEHEKGGWTRNQHQAFFFCRGGEVAGSNLPLNFCNALSKYPTRWWNRSSGRFCSVGNTPTLDGSGTGILKFLKWKEGHLKFVTVCWCIDTLQQGMPHMMDKHRIESGNDVRVKTSSECIGDVTPPSPCSTLCQSLFFKRVSVTAVLKLFLMHPCSHDQEKGGGTDKQNISIHPPTFDV